MRLTPSTITCMPHSQHPIRELAQLSVPIERELLHTAGRDRQRLEAVDLRLQSCGVELVTRVISHPVQAQL